MSSIAFIHSGKSFMPEIGAYQNYFEHAEIKTGLLVNPSQPEMEPYDILWFFMGIQNCLNDVNKKKIIVHEYCSASTPPLARLKDIIKKIITPMPNLRISLSTEHRGRVYPVDDIPLIVRRQGVHSCFFKKIYIPKEYDFIYIGSALKMRHTNKWLHEFAAMFPRMSIIMVGNHESGIIQQFKSNPNIHFEKPVPITSLPELLAKARFAVNYVPDVYPFNIQPSTKLLEYCAAGCHIISNRYHWVNQFAQKTKAGIFFMDDLFENLSATTLETFQFTVPDMSVYEWERIFKEMQIQSYLPV